MCIIVYTSDVSGPTYFDQKDSELKGIFGFDYHEDVTQVNLSARKVLDRLDGMAAIDHKRDWTLHQETMWKINIKLYLIINLFNYS